MLRALFGNKAKAQSESTVPDRVPHHVAMIMDGNGRWARSKNLPRVEGHRAGAKTVRRMVESCLKAGVNVLTVYAFSSENWNRPADEVSALMKLFERYLSDELELFLKHNVRLRAIGDRSKLSPGVLNALNKAESLTAGNSAMQFVIAVSYGSQEELVYAAKNFAKECLEGKFQVDELTTEGFSKYLYGSDLPPVDLLIRTSNEFRVSNFLLWQIAYAEIYVTPVLWPDFSETELFHSFEVYSKRERRFGLTAEQVLENKKSNVA
jgi:undecaprenyl diphosphate synthase